MINFFSETSFNIDNKEQVADWIKKVIAKESYELGNIDYVFCSDDYLHKLNVDFLNHDTLTDIISFDYSMGREVSGEIYISIDRVIENAKEFKVTFENELHRVIIHGVLHYLGFKDKEESDKKEMRKQENEALEARSFV